MLKNKELKLNRYSWYLYDSGNSILNVAVGGLFLGQWIIIDLGYSDIWYGGVFILSTIFILFLSPLFGAWSDKLGVRRPFVIALTLGLYLCSFLLGILTVLDVNVSYLIIAVAILVLIMQIFYQLSLVFINSLLDVISSEKDRGKISGIGEVFNNLGWLVGAAVLTLFAQGTLHTFGAPGRVQVFLPAAVMFMLLTLPFILLFKEQKKEIRSTQKVDYRGVLFRTFKGMKLLFVKNKNVGIYLIGFAFIADAILTMSLYFAVAMERMYGIPDTQKFGLVAFMFLWVAAGSYFMGRFSDKFGAKSLLLLSTILMSFALLFAFARISSIILFPLMVPLGLGMGGFFATSRTLLTKIAPPSRLGEYFGYYSTFARLSSIIGPAMWGVTILLFAKHQIFSYQIAGWSLVLLMIIGIVIITKVDENVVGVE